MKGILLPAFFEKSTTRKLIIKYPMTIIGAGQNQTFLSGCSLYIEGLKEEGKRVVLKDMTTSSQGAGFLHGLFR